jgi:anaerobic selenocysteine-containing dehydrogenase
MQLKTACNRDCPDTCGILATVENGRVTRIQGDPDHPVTRGFLCRRTNRFLAERQYHPDRLTTPLIRRGADLKPIDWDDALDLVAEKLLRIKAESGAAAILHYRSGGSLGLMKHVSDAFFEHFGPVTVKSGDICSGPGEAAQELDFGTADSSDLFDLLNARTIVLWGKNPHVSNVHLLPILKQAAGAGTRLIQIDPIRHRGADLCHDYLQPRPGGDIALALGVTRRLFDLGRVDPAAASWCDHLDGFRELVEARGAEAWAEAAGVTPRQLETLAEAYADGPSTILVGWGMQRRGNGATAIRVLDALGAVSGNIGRPGAGVSFYFKRRGPFDLSFSAGKEAAPRTIPEPLLGPGILAADPAIRLVWVTAGNPVAMLPESATVARALATREMTVVVDSFLTDTARQAHLVLPTTTMLEEDDLLGAYGHHWIVESRPVVRPPDGVKTDYEICRALAERLRLGDTFTPSPEEWKRRMLASVPGASLESLRDGALRNPLAPEVLFEGRRFKTESGRANLVHEIDDPDPPLPTAERPLLLMPVATERSQASQSTPEAQTGPAPATVHPDAANGCPDGGRARLESEIGAIEVRVRHDAGQRRDVVIMEKGGWHHAGRCANALIRAELTDAGEGARFYETPVRLVPLPAPEEAG